jgi:hypothetical protein
MSETDDLQLALVAFIGATGAGPEGIGLCSLLMDRADAALDGAAGLMRGVGIQPRRKARLQLGKVCRACAACPRGRSNVMALFPQQRPSPPARPPAAADSDPPT